MPKPSRSQPLVSRPAYGQEPAKVVGEAKLPQGTPGGKGISFNSDGLGLQTFTKPEEDIRDPDPKDESIFRRQFPDDLAKEQSRPDVNESNADKHNEPSYTSPGPQDASPKTKYPYRDDKPNAHNASYVVGVVLAERAPQRVFTATKLGEIEQGLNPEVKTKGKTCSVQLKRADIKNLRWIFSVDCGNGSKVVRLKATRSNASQMKKLDLHLSCSCPAWRWLGPEHHSKREEYLDGNPRGTASIPRIKDPEGVNRVCKHVAAVLGTIRKWQLSKPKSKKENT